MNKQRGKGRKEERRKEGERSATKAIPLLFAPTLYFEQHYRLSFYRCLLIFLVILVVAGCLKASVEFYPDDSGSGLHGNEHEHDHNDDDNVNVLPTSGSLGIECEEINWFSETGTDTACYNRMLADENCGKRFMTYNVINKGCACYPTDMVVCTIRRADGRTSWDFEPSASSFGGDLIDITETTSKDSLLQQQITHTPAFSVNGNNATLVIFFHNPKTGGTSIQKTFKGVKNLEYHFASGLDKSRKAESKINTWLKEISYNNNGTLSSQQKRRRRRMQFVEIHAGTCPSFMNFRSTIQSWREQSLKIGINFFAFTLLRKPEEHIESLYNHVCVRRQKCGVDFSRPAVDSFLEMDLENNQARYFSNGYGSIGKKRRDYVTRETTDILIREMKTHFDWIGTTSCLTNDTFPLLHKIILFDNEITSNVGREVMSKTKTKKFTKFTVKTSMLNEGQRKYLKNKTTLDSYLYNQLVDHYGSCLK